MDFMNYLIENIKVHSTYCVSENNFISIHILNTQKEKTPWRPLEESRY
jgi:hypothetical protein